MLGQSVFRTGLSKVGLPGAKEGINVLDPTVAVLMKDQGYATGQFGKNHFGDHIQHLLRLAPRSRLPACSGPGLCGEFPRNF
jgi:arylsulfatase A-like enzyme